MAGVRLTCTRPLVLTVLLTASILFACRPGILPEGESPAHTPVQAGSRMPDALNCALVESTGRGASWRGLQIGISTADEVAQTLNGGVWLAEYGHQSHYSTTDSAGWVLAQSCTTDGTLSALYLYKAQEYDGLRLADWIDRLGQPDRVTWARDYYSRSLVWAEEGILVVMMTSPEGTEAVILFPPIVPGDLDESWLMRSLPTGGEIMPWASPPFLTDEDPWGIAQE